MLTSFNGMRIITDINMTEVGPVDWSRIRSPSRALRRQRKRPLPHLIVPRKEAYQIGGHTLVMHPDMLRALELHVAAQR